MSRLESLVVAEHFRDAAEIVAVHRSEAASRLSRASAFILSSRAAATAIVGAIDLRVLRLPPAE